MSGPCMCGDPCCSQCFVQPSACPLCGRFRPQDCENCWNEATEGPCAGCPCDCLCDQAEIDEWNREAAAEDARLLQEEMDGAARYDLMTEGDY